MIIEKLIDTFHVYNFYPWEIYHNPVLDKVCSLPLIGNLCHKLNGRQFDPDIDAMEREDMVLSNFPAGAGWKTQIHYFQMDDCKTNCFRRYDYETPEANMEKYN